jgi:murein DD-endopeptidase MepM/ murein hydrolase activator NlpD
MMTSPRGDGLWLWRRSLVLLGGVGIVLGVPQVLDSTRSAAAGAGATEAAVTPTPTRTPAIQPDANQKNVALTRVEFEELGLKMVGMGSFMGRTSAFIQHPGSRDQMIYEAGDVVGGFRIVSIQAEYVVFERGGIQLWLAMGSSPNVEEDARPEPKSKDLRFAAVQYKHREPGLKTKTKAYDEAKVIAADAAPAPSKTSTRRSAKSSEETVVASADRERFIAPLKGRLSSGFGYRQSPMGGGRKYHSGIDIAAPYKSPIRAAASGKVIKAARSWSRGRHVIIQHADGYSTAYFHLASTDVKEGDWVKQGEIIGREGSTGISTGPHLHFEIHRNGQAVDPALYIKEYSKR